MRLLHEDKNTDELINFLEALFGKDLPNGAFNDSNNKNTIDKLEKNICNGDASVAKALYTLIYDSIINTTAKPLDIYDNAYDRLNSKLSAEKNDVKEAFIRLCKNGKKPTSISFQFKYNGITATVIPGQQYGIPYEQVITGEGQAGKTIFMNPNSGRGQVFVTRCSSSGGFSVNSLPYNVFISLLKSSGFPRANTVFFDVNSSNSSYLIFIVDEGPNKDASVLVYDNDKGINNKAYSLLNYLATSNPAKSDITKITTPFASAVPATNYFKFNSKNNPAQVLSLLNVLATKPYYFHVIKAPFSSSKAGKENEVVAYNYTNYKSTAIDDKINWQYQIETGFNISAYKAGINGADSLESLMNKLLAGGTKCVGFGIIDNDAPDFVQKDRMATDFSRNKTQNDSAIDNALGTANLSQHINGNGTINRNAESAYERRYRQQMRLFEDKRVLDDFIVQAKDADGKDIIIPKNLDAINENDIYKLVDVIYQWFGKPSSNPWFSKLMSEEKDFVDLLCAAIGTTREDCEDYIETAGRKLDDSLFNGKSKDADGHRQLKKSLFEVYPSLRSKKPDEKAYSMLISMYPKIFLNKFWALISHWKSLTGEETKQLISRTESFDLTDMLHNFILDKCLHAMILDGIPGTRANQINGEPRHYICSCEAVLTCYFADAQDAKFKSTNPDRDVNLRDMFTARLKQNLATFKNDNILDLLNPDNISGLNDKETAELFFRGSLSLDDAGNGDDDRALGDKLGDLLAKGKTLGGGSTVDQSAALIDFENAWRGIAMDDSLNDLNILDKKAGKMISNRTAICAILKMLEKPYDKEKDADNVVATYAFKHSKDFTKLLSELLQVHGIVTEFALGFSHFGANELCRMLRSGRQLSDDELADDEEKSRKNRLLSKWKKIKTDDMILDENLDESKPDIFFLKAYLYSKDEYVKGEKNAFALDEEIKDYGSKKVQAFLRTDEFKDFLKELLDAYDLTKSDLNELLELYTPVELFDMIDH